jgi:glucosylceramidase
MPNNPNPSDPVVLGSWERAVNYASDIIQDFNHLVSGWTDWNLVLDMEGGPNWAKNFVDAPIIADK